MAGREWVVYNDVLVFDWPYQLDNPLNYLGGPKQESLTCNTQTGPSSIRPSAWINQFKQLNLTRDESEPELCGGSKLLNQAGFPHLAEEK